MININQFRNTIRSKKNILCIVIPLCVGTLIFHAITIMDPVQQRKEASYYYQGITEKVRTENLYRTIFYLQSQKNRSTWEKQWEVAYWIFAEFKKIGIRVDIHKYEFQGKIWPNVIARLEGKEKTGENFLFCAHLDSTSDNAEKIAPGADDNAGSVAVLLEAARVLQKMPMKRTVIFCIFSNEESAAAGSKAYARLVKKERYNIKAVINIDAIGYNNPPWPLYWDAISGHAKPKDKFKAAAKMVYNYCMGIVYGKDTVVVAGKAPNRQLALNTSLILLESAGLKVKKTIHNDCG